MFNACDPMCIGKNAHRKKKVDLIERVKRIRGSSSKAASSK
jgi:hypothetical protein